MSVEFTMCQFAALELASSRYTDLVDRACGQEDRGVHHAAFRNFTMAAIGYRKLAVTAGEWGLADLQADLISLANVADSMAHDANMFIEGDEDDDDGYGMWS